MWELEPTDEYERRLKWYAKKRRRELKAVLDNLDDFHEALLRGAKPQQIKTGYIHPEPMGVLAFDQKGGGAGLAETRIYVLPDEPTETLHQLTIGDKKSQSDDITYCKQFVEKLRKEREGQDDAA